MKVYSFFFSKKKRYIFCINKNNCICTQKIIKLSEYGECKKKMVKTHRKTAYLIGTSHPTTCAKLFVQQAVCGVLRDIL